MSNFTRIKQYVLGGIFMLVMSWSYAQSTTITGQVTGSDDGDVLPGATVMEKGTTNGTITDMNGNYSLTVSQGATLIFSFVGYNPQEMVVGSQSTINTTLEVNTSALDEVVVIGYGQADKKEITSSVVSVGQEQFNKGNVNDPVQFLQGKVAGLSIARPGNDPNGGFSVRLRGLSTFGANASPLIVIDGVLGGSLQQVDPNDIESIEVLKDASAAAIYGSRGASGVIIVTTKSGTEMGEPQIDYNGYIAFEQVAKFVENSTPAQYIEAGGVDNGYETDWLDLLTETGVTTVHNVSATNGFKNGSYRVSVNYRDVEGIAIGNGFEQINARLNLKQRAINDKLQMDFNIGITKREADFVNYESLRFAVIADPTAPVYNNDDPTQGYWEPNTPEYHNPYAIANDVTLNGTFKTLLGNLKLDYEILEGLHVGAFYSLQYQSDLESQYYSSTARFASGQGQGGRARKAAEDRNNELFEITGNFVRQLGDLKVNVVGGYSYQYQSFENFNAFNTNFITNDLLYNSLELGLGTSTGNLNLYGMGSQLEENKLISFFGRTMFNYQDKLFLSISYRREGSSKFGVNNRWGNFYAVSGGADLASLFSIPANTLKLRVGYGVTGNLPNQNYAYRVRLTDGDRIFFNSSEYIVGVNYASNPNPDLKWEQKAETNFGVDYAFLNSRLTGSVDYYVRNTTDLLTSISVPVPPNFFGSTLVNVGELKSSGLEIAVNYAAVQTAELNISTGLIFSTFNTELVKFDGERDQIFIGNLGPPGLNGVNVIKVAEGDPIGDIVAPIFEGLNEDGTRRLTDQDGDGNITQEGDAVVVGNGLPDFELAWNTSVSYKGFDLSLVIRGAFGHSLVNINRAYYESRGAANNYNPVRTKYWLPDLVGGENWNSYYVEKADFVKLDNITLGYTVNTDNADFIKNLRVYFTAQNPIVITDYTGVDPEVHYSYGSPLAPGVDDRNSYFRTRTFTFGVNLGF